MAAPLLGITTYRQPHAQGFPVNSVVEAYVQAVSQSGGIPVLIPLGLPEAQLRELVARLDGVLFSGGGDIDPQRYGAEGHPAVSGVDLDRDRVELCLVPVVIQKRMPFFGICRGIQTLNVALGGTLYTHIPDQLPGALPHPHVEGNRRDDLAHEVWVKPGSQLADILGVESTLVNSLHHQGVREIAPGLEATAFAPDGLVEGVELANYPFGIAVQWHPEWLMAHAPMRALFTAFVEAARR